MHANIRGTQIYFDVDGSELTVEPSGLVQRPVLIALHGGPGFDQGYLRPGLGALREAAQVVYVDLRCQGRSGRPSLDTCTFDQMADDLAALCELLGIVRPFILGHSAGGFVALHLAVRHAALVQGLVLSNTSATMAPQDDGVPPPNLAERAGPEVAAIAQSFFGGDASPERVAEFTARVMPFYAGPSHMDVPKELMRLSSLSLDVVQHFIARLAPTYDVRAMLGTIAAPTLVIIGKHDWVCTPAAGRALARGIPGAKLLEIEEVGHFPFSEEPAQFLGAVTRFLREGCQAQPTVGYTAGQM